MSDPVAIAIIGALGFVVGCYLLAHGMEAFGVAAAAVQARESERARAHAPQIEMLSDPEKHR